MLSRIFFIAPVLLFSFFLATCGGGGGDNAGAPPSASVDTFNPGSDSPTGSSALQPVTPTFQLDTTARFNRPTDLTVDREGNLYVVDSGNQSIRLIAPTGDVSTLSGTFTEASDITADQNGGLIVLSGASVYRLSSNGISSLVKSYTVSSGSYLPYLVASDGLGRIYVLTRYRQIFRVERIDPDNTTTSVFYLSTFGSITGMAADLRGNLALLSSSPTGENFIEYVPLSAQTTGDVHSLGTTTLPISNANFSIGSIAFDQSGNIYAAGANRFLSDSSDIVAYDAIQVIRASTNGSSSIVFSGFPAGNSLPRYISRLSYLRVGLTFGPSGNLYISDPFDHAIYSLSLTGQMNLIAGNPGFYGSSN